MDLRIDKPEWCNDCVFGEESGYCCSLLNGELCYKHGDYEKHRPDWCPFDNDGKTITADGVTLLKEQETQKFFVDENGKITPLPVVVRCKDCKWWDKKDGANYGYCHACKHGYYSDHWEIGIYRTYKGDWFCADGEHK